MNKTLFSLFLFSSMLFSATFNIVNHIPNSTIAGSVYPLEYSVCLNNAQPFQIIHNITNQSEFDGAEFNFTNCYYENLSYICNYNGTKGTQTIKQNLSINKYIANENYSINSIFAIQFAEENNCNPYPIIPPSTTSSGSGSSGGSFYPRPPYTVPSQINNTQEPVNQTVPIKNTTQTPQNVTKNMTKPVQNVTQNTTQPLQLFKSVEEITKPIIQNKEKEFPEWFGYILLALGISIIAVIVILGYLATQIKPPKEKLPSERMAEIITENGCEN